MQPLKLRRLGDHTHPASLVRPRPSGSSELLWAALTGAAVFAATVARVPSAWRTIWAEDGKVFLAGAVKEGSSSLFHFFGGYLHMVPRLGALTASIFPLSLAPLVITGYAVLIASICGATVEVLNGAYVKARWVRVGVGLCFGLLPAIRIETIAEMANLQYFLVAASFWALLVIPRSRNGTILSIVFLVATALSSVLGFFLFPVAGLRMLRRKGHLPATAFVCAQVFHGLAILIARPRRQVGVTASMHNVMAHLVYDLFAGQFFGGPFYQLDYRYVTVPVMGVAAVTCFILLLLDRPHGEAERLIVALGAAVLGVMMYVWEARTQGPAARYAVVPAFLVLFAVGIVADVATRLRVARTVAYVAAVAVALSWGLSFQVSAYRDTGPRWSSAYVRAQRACDGATGNQRIPILPLHWTMTLPCSAIVAGPG